VDVTVIGQGRYIPRIKRIAEQVPELNIVVATGCYTFDEVPMFFWRRTPDDEALAGRPAADPMQSFFVRDITDGITGTGVRAGMLKCAVDANGLTPGVERVLRNLESMAESGLTLGMDRFGIDHFASFEERSDLVVELCRRGLAGRMVLSHHTCCHIDWFSPRSLTALTDWHYLHISQDVLPYLRDHGVPDDDVDAMLVRNPARILCGLSADYLRCSDGALKNLRGFSGVLRSFVGASGTFRSTDTWGGIAGRVIPASNGVLDAPSETSATSGPGRVARGGHNRDDHGAGDGHARRRRHDGGPPAQGRGRAPGGPQRLPDAPD
jgi:hypothetical protein